MFFPEFREVGYPEVISVLALIGFLLLTLSYFLNYWPLTRFKAARLETGASLPPVSVIICAKNEDENLIEFLPKIMQQEYPEFEVIVVNDCSYDNTENVVDGLAKTYPNLRKATIKEDPYYKHGKKFAMLVGIKAATHIHLVFTDADCYPASNQWLKEMAMGFTESREIVIGYGAYEKQEGFLNKLIRFDTFIIAVNYFSAAIRNQPYMGVGRNLAYTSQLFFREKGFATHYHLTSGDDDLFVNQAASATNTNICATSNGITYSKPEKTFKQWNIQKTRHLSTGPLYNGATKRKLYFNYFSQYFFYLTLLPLAFSFKTVLLIPIFLLLKAILQTALLNTICKRLNEKDLLAGAMVYELILLFIYPIFHISKLFYKPNKWTN